MQNRKSVGYKRNATYTSFSIAYRALGCLTFYISPKKCNKLTLALWKNLRLQLYMPAELQPRSSRTLRIQLSNKQMDLANTFVEKERQRWETQWAMGNVESASKNIKTFSFLWRKLAEKIFWQNIWQYAAQLDSNSSINAKILAFPSLL